MKAPWLQPETPEDAFVARYRWLLGWALKLTNNRPDEAEDLLQTAFVQFTLRRPDLTTISNLDGYLYTMLRNLRLSQVRRAARVTNTSLSILDYDSPEIAFHTIDPQGQLQARDELRAICKYACQRKESSKAGSVLLLRFFHGFYPSEIARILRTDVAAVNHWLRLARGEARLYLEDPEALSFLRRDTASKTEPSKTSDDLWVDLREALAASRRGSCWSNENLTKLYAPETKGTVPSDVLAHLVSCRTCLDRVTRLLGLGPLSERNPFDTLGPSSPSQSSRQTNSQKSAQPNVHRWNRNLRNIVEHSPSELRILVNGFGLGSMRVQGESTELTIAVNVDEPIAFIEVVSDQDLLLLHMDIVPPPEGGADQRLGVDLTHGRRLDVTLDFSHPWPLLHAAYEDPLFVSESMPNPNEPEARLLFDAAEGGDVRQGRARGFGFGWLDALRPANWRLGHRLAPAAIVIALVAVVWSGLQLRGPTLSAAELLDRAAVSERAAAAVPATMVHRVLRVEERQRPTGTVRTRRRVEVWHSTDTNVKARRLYDERNRLLAGEWTHSDGSRTVYERGAEPRRERPSDPKPLDSKSVWRWEPLTTDFSRLIPNVASLQVDHRREEYLLTYRDARGESAAIVEASLTLDIGFHALEQTIVLREAGATTEYRIEETESVQTPAREVDAAVLEPDPELIPTVVTSSAPAALAPALPKPVPPTMSEIGALDRLEIDVWHRLHTLRLSFGDTATVTRTADSRLDVRVLAFSDLRRTALENALAPVRANTAIRVLVEDADQASAAGGMRSVTAVSPQGPMVDRLRAAFTRRMSASDAATIDTVTRETALWALERTAAARERAAALERFINRWRVDETQRLDLDGLTKWFSIVRDHALEIGEITEEIRDRVGPLLEESASPPSISQIDQLGDRGDVVNAATHLIELAVRQHDVVVRALSGDALFDITSVSRALRATEIEATRFTGPWSLR